MIRTFTTYSLDNKEAMKLKMLNWCKRFNIFCLLDNHASGNSFHYLLGAGVSTSLERYSGTAFESLQKFKEKNKDWIFGHLSYDLKNETEELYSNLPDHIELPDLFFFVPKVVLILNDGELLIGVLDDDADLIFNELNSTPENEINNSQKIALLNRIPKETYIDIVNKLKHHIQIGDCYEINYCQEYYAENICMDPFNIFKKLTQISPNPFAAFYRNNDKYLMCASPERFLKKTGMKIISQPIKGTAKRNWEDEKMDIQNKENLLKSIKETSENVMVTDLVRNDLSKVCLEGSVTVEELLGLYTFPHVHQMISTVSGTLNTENMSDILKSTFPMGSMTGVPKKRVMELIEKYEASKRGLYSGAVGYIDPEGNFDFNVVIRSLLYNDTNQFLSVHAGSAITIHSNAKEEYEECLLKIQAIKEVLQA